MQVDAMTEEYENVELPDKGEPEFIKLPLSPAELDSVPGRFGARSWHDLSWRCADCKIPSIRDTISTADSIRQLNLIGTYTTGQDGTVTVTGLIPGSTVVVTEIKVPAGYVLAPKPQTITVKNGSNTVTNGSSASGNNGLTFENDPTMSLMIHKYIEGTANEPLAGVAFKVVDGSGAPVGTGDGTFYTDAAGEIVIDGLEPGMVTL